MLHQVHLEDILFLDIETVPQHADYEELSEPMKKLWNKKASFLKKEEMDNAENLYPRAGIYAEFGKIVCISVGFIKDEQLRIKSFAHQEEKQLLKDFKTLLDSHYCMPQYHLCAHNGKEFDFPYIARRMLLNGLELPVILQMQGKKPWEIKHLDTLELWKFGDYKHYTSLELLTAIFGIPTPKSDIDGSKVYEVFWKEKNLERIVKYCEQDVIAIVQLFQKYNTQELFPAEKITIVK